MTSHSVREVMQKSAISFATQQLWSRNLRPLPDPISLTTQLLLIKRRGAMRATTLVLHYGIEQLANVCGSIIYYEKLHYCTRPAGHGTYHEGDGPCCRHESMRSSMRNAEMAWIMAHKFAQEYNCTPWEGLLKAVRIAAGKVAYTEYVLSCATHDVQFEGRLLSSNDDDGGVLRIINQVSNDTLNGVNELRDLSWWVHKNEYWVAQLARYSKMAIDAGVAERMVAVEKANAEHIASVLNSVIATIERDNEVDTKLLSYMRTVMREKLMELDDGIDTVVNGEVIDELIL